MTSSLSSLTIVADGDLILGDPAAPVVPWWSFAKTVLAVAALVLVRDGKLTLERPLPGQPYNLQQLLAHTAGVPNYADLAVYADAVRRGDQPWPADHLLTLVQARQPLFAPGQGWHYSNTGYLLVRQLIENTLGASLQEALQQLIFSPLEIGGVSVAEQRTDLQASAWGNSCGYHPGWVYHGLLLGTPAAAALLLDRLLTGTLLPASQLALMCRMHALGEHLPGRPWRDFGYGLGLMMARGSPAGPSLGHTGAGPVSVAAVYRFPERALTIAAFAPSADQALVEWAVHDAALNHVRA